MKVTLSSVSFIQIGTSNTYNARTDWTMPTYGNPPRPCQVLNQTANDAAPTPNGVPVGFWACHARPSDTAKPSAATSRPWSVRSNGWRVDSHATDTGEFTPC